ncbi:M81 family metallopeptidase [Candidimonas nitroreducens]|uniref:Microcystin degradation protein MlrC n=1 Tax=Candidimonas nitroreducens TaxID=683354 RepID=A0A225M6C8_9BURK|nr:M81 family metallopeptidase [Candidimonas nitroreducens]OWT56877.1 microcystin degradation protein MlrC [Candidimonas nitroreducens]
MVDTFDGSARGEHSEFRVALAGFHIECVSFLPKAATYADFESQASRGERIFENLRGTNTVMGGFIEVCEREHVAMMPIVNAALGAVGPTTDEVVERYAEEMAQAIRAQADTLDGVLLFLHGACWAPSYRDPERYFIDRVRGAIGPGKPIMVALDYHGNIDAETLKNATAAFAYQRSPHTDTGDTGRRAADCLVRTLRGQIRPTWAIAKPGVLVPSIFSATALHPLADIIKETETAEQNNARYLDISVMAGFSYADAHNTGFSVLVVADDDQQQAEKLARTFSDKIWAARNALYRPLRVYSVTEAVDHVTAQVAAGEGKGRPYVLLEHADRMNDSTYILAEVLKRRLERVAAPFIWDAASAKKACEAGAGSEVRLQLGGHSSDKAGPTLDVKAKVLWAGTKRYRVSGTYMHGMPVNLGECALLDIDGVSVSVVSRFAFAVDGDPFYVFGLKPEDFDIIILRSKTHFRAFYEPLAREILIVDTPDYGLADLKQLPYQHLQMERVFPFSEDAARRT